jgi:hypothetical protein
MTQTISINTDLLITSVGHFNIRCYECISNDYAFGIKAIYKQSDENYNIYYNSGKIYFDFNEFAFINQETAFIILYNGKNVIDNSEEKYMILNKERKNYYDSMSLERMYFNKTYDITFKQDDVLEILLFNSSIERIEDRDALLELINGDREFDISLFDKWIKEPEMMNIKFIKA